MADDDRSKAGADAPPPRPNRRRRPNPADEKVDGAPTTATTITSGSPAPPSASVEVGSSSGAEVVAAAPAAVEARELFPDISGHTISLPMLADVLKAAERDDSSLARVKQLTIECGSGATAAHQPAFDAALRALRQLCTLRIEGNHHLGLSLAVLPTLPMLKNLIISLPHRSTEKVALTVAATIDAVYIDGAEFEVTFEPRPSPMPAFTVEGRNLPEVFIEQVGANPHMPSIVALELHCPLDNRAGRPLRYPDGVRTLGLGKVDDYANFWVTLPDQPLPPTLEEIMVYLDDRAVIPAQLPLSLVDVTLISRDGLPVFSPTCFKHVRKYTFCHFLKDEVDKPVISPRPILPNATDVTLDVTLERLPTGSLPRATEVDIYAVDALEVGSMPEAVTLRIAFFGTTVVGSPPATVPAVSFGEKLTKLEIDRLESVSLTGSFPASLTEAKIEWMINSPAFPAGLFGSLNKFRVPEGYPAPFRDSVCTGPIGVLELNRLKPTEVELIGKVAEIAFSGPMPDDLSWLPDSVRRVYCSDCPTIGRLMAARPWLKLQIGYGCTIAGFPAKIAGYHGPPLKTVADPTDQGPGDAIPRALKLHLTSLSGSHLDLTGFPTTDLTLPAHANLCGWPAAVTHLTLLIGLLYWGAPVDLSHWQPPLSVGEITLRVDSGFLHVKSEHITPLPVAATTGRRLRVEIAESHASTVADLWARIGELLPSGVTPDEVVETRR